MSPGERHRSPSAGERDGVTERERLAAMERDIDARAIAETDTPAWLFAMGRNDIQLERDLLDQEARESQARTAE